MKRLGRTMVCIATPLFTGNERLTRLVHEPQGLHDNKQPRPIISAIAGTLFLPQYEYIGPHPYICR